MAKDVSTDRSRPQPADPREEAPAGEARDDPGATLDWPSPTTGTGTGSVPILRPPTNEDLDDSVGLRLGPYEIRALIGRGGVGKVYRAFDHRLERMVALKLLRMESAEAASRLLNEARSQARVDHPNICRVYDAGEISGRPFIAMQYIEGRPLSRVFPELTLREKVEVMYKVAEGIHAAHLQGQIHRDIKPGNIMVDRSPSGEWRPYVLDFGLAKQLETPGETTTGEVKGTPSYMPPEQVSGQVRSLDERADVYSLGATLYEGIVGRSLFADTTGVAVLLKVLNEDPEPLRYYDRSVPIDVESVVMRCLEKDPQKRYPTAQALAEDLERFLAGEPVEARSVTIFDRLYRRLKRRKVAALTVGLVLTLLLSAAFFVVSELRDQRRSRLMDRHRQVVRFVDDLLRDAYEAPLHDTTEQKEKVRARLSQVEAAAEVEGRLGRGPSNYALGRGYLALGEYERARRHLDVAWESGTHDPEVAYALGRTLGALYQTELRAARRLDAGEQRETRIREIQATYRDPALDYLRRAGDVESDSVELVEALMAFWEERYDEALEKARAAWQRIPWLHEAIALEGDIYVARGTESYLSGDYEAAMGYYLEAREAYAAAAERGRSDARIYEGQCQLGADLVRLASYALHASHEEHFEYGREACARARQVDPERAEAYLLESILYYRMGEHQLYAGVDPEAYLNHAAEAAAAEVLMRDAESVEALASQGFARALLAQWQVDHGIDPRTAVAKAAESFHRALAFEPNFAKGHNGLGYTRYHQARWQLEHGEYPGDTLSEAIDAFSRALAIDPKYLYPHDNLANAHVLAASWDLARGQDPVDHVQAVVDVAGWTREANPNYVWGFSVVGDAWERRAQYLVERGEDPAPSVESGRRAYEEALTVAEEGWVLIGLGRLALHEGRFLAGDGDPAKRFEAARRSLERGLELGHGDSWTSQWAYQSLAELDRFVAAWKVERGGNPSSEVAHGRQMVADALAINPSLTEVVAIGGVLEILAAAAERDPRRRQGALDQGRRVLVGALEKNPHLERRYGKTLSPEREGRGS